ncbi:MAG TPA: HAD family hydrolase [Chloroflexota bacterium]|nr:HAD family hydrolase [Chloroflexota bacterium]
MSGQSDDQFPKKRVAAGSVRKNIDRERFRAISFDGDGTLWDFDAVMRHALRCALDELVQLYPDARERLSIDRMIAIRDQVAREMKGRVRDLEEIRFLAFRQSLREIDVADDGLAHHLNAVYLKHRFEDITLYPDVVPALEALATRYRLGLLSNGNSYPERCGLAGRFSFVVLAQDYGVEKPDPRIFAIALEQVGCTSDELLHVGDSLVNDVWGAQRAGITAILLNRHGTRNTAEIRPDGEIASLLDLLPIIEQVTEMTDPFHPLRSGGNR